MLHKKFNNVVRDLSGELLLATIVGDLAKAKILIEEYPDLATCPHPLSGKTAVNIAIFRQDLPMLKLLLEAPGADPHVKDAMGRKPIDMCIYTINEEIFEYVIEKTYPEALRELDAIEPSPPK